jgi:hypothetical protein
MNVSASHNNSSVSRKRKIICSSDEESNDDVQAKPQAKPSNKQSTTTTTATTATTATRRRARQKALRNKRGDELDWLLEDFGSMQMPLKFLGSIFDEAEFIIGPHPDKSVRQLQLTVHAITDSKITSVGFEYVPFGLKARQLPMKFRVKISQFTHALGCMDTKSAIRIYKTRQDDGRIVIEPHNDTFVSLRRFVDLLELQPPVMAPELIRKSMNRAHTINVVFNAKRLKDEFNCALKAGHDAVRFRLLEHDDNIYFGIVSPASALYKFCVCKRTSEVDRNGQISFNASDATELEPPDMSCLNFSKMEAHIDMKFAADILHSFVKGVDGMETSISIGLTPDQPVLLVYDVNDTEFGVFKIATAPKIDDED